MNEKSARETRVIVHLVERNLRRVLFVVLADVSADVPTGGSKVKVHIWDPREEEIVNDAGVRLGQGTRMFAGDVSAVSCVKSKEQSGISRRSD